jgi:hypothetical protein
VKERSRQETAKREREGKGQGVYEGGYRMCQKEKSTEQEKPRFACEKCIKC